MPPLNTPISALRTISKLAYRPSSSRPSLAFLLPYQQQQRQIPHPRQFHVSKQLLSSENIPTPTAAPATPSSQSTSRPLTDRTASSSSPSKPKTPSFSHRPKRPLRPEYKITFTCDPCSTRSSHYISKQGYHRGSVLISCPECKNRHVISDHLGIFGDRNITIEDLMKERGQLVKKGSLSEEGGDIEFWEDEVVTKKTAGDGNDVGIAAP